MYAAVKPMEEEMGDYLGGPLQGIKVLELGSSVSGPYCGRLMADFGAEVIKVEVDSGDPVRNMGKRSQGRSLYGASIFRNKELISVDLRTQAGRDLIARLSGTCDVVIENFRPGTLKKWELDYDRLSSRNPGLVMVHISGFGQTGPYRERAGYGAIGGAISGLRHLTGDPDRPPARIAASVEDEVTAIYAAFGAVMALRVRDQTGKGQEIDSALYESAFSLIEPYVPAYSKLGIVPERTGSRLPDSAPNNLYESHDGLYIHITAMADSVFARLAKAMGRPELTTDPLYRAMPARSENEAALDKIIGEWALGLGIADLEEILNDNEVPAQRIYDMKDIFEDPHFHHREMLVKVEDPVLGELTVPGVVPKLSATPGRITHAGHDVGQDTHSVLRRLLGLSDKEIQDLQSSGAVFCKQISSSEAPATAKVCGR